MPVVQLIGFLTEVVYDLKRQNFFTLAKKCQLEILITCVSCGQQH